MLLLFNGRVCSLLVDAVVPVYVPVVLVVVFVYSLLSLLWFLLLLFLFVDDVVTVSCCSRCLCVQK